RAGTGNVTFIDTTVAAGNSYTYQVAAVNGAGTSAFSNQATVTVPVVLPLPAAPTNLTAALQAGPQVSLAWTDNATNETGFVVERSLNGGAFSTLASLAADTVSYLDTTVASGKTYSYRVHAVNASGPSANSNTVNVNVPLPVPPAAPSNPFASNITRTSLTLNWLDNSDNETGFTIQIATNGRFNANLQTFTVGPNVQSFNIPGLTRATRYFIRVAAFNAAGTSPWTPTFNARTLR
ncbi:MAG TPA: fibronectin type III domain-containing protein, partial [Anaerolineales bacterium]